MKILGSPIISIFATLIFGYFLAKYWILLSQQTWRYRYLLFLLRTLSILCFLFLLLNPWMSWTQNKTNSQNISVICDVSESMLNHFTYYPQQYDEIQRKIKIWGDKHKLNLNFFRLGRKILKLENMEYVDQTTDFRDIPDFISFEQPQQILLITDGKATAGKNINNIEFSQHHPIHTLGVGPIKKYQDIAIQDIIIPDLLASGDTVNIKIRIKSSIQERIQSVFKIINESDIQIYYNRIQFEKGNRLLDLTLELSADLLLGLNVASISPVPDEKALNNNTFTFRVDLQDSVDDIILITGALSQNSRMIAGQLEDIENAKIHHSFRMESELWNEEPLKEKYHNLKMIVLDDFPIYNEDSPLFQKIVALGKNQQVSVIYLQGPWANLAVGEMIHSAYPDFLAKIEDSEMLMGISPNSNLLNNSIIALEQLPPQHRSIKWISPEKPWVSYMDESVLIGNKNNFYLVSLPTLAESHYKISPDLQSIFTKLIKKVFLHAFHGSAGLLNLELNGQSFNKGEIFQFSLAHVNELDLMEFTIHAIGGSDTLQLECTEDGWNKGMQCSTALLIPGKYTFFARALLPSGKHVYSNTKLAVIQDVKVEMKELIQERKALIEIAYKTGGTYASIDSLDTMLAHIDITPVQYVNKHQISSISSQNYWWILILLLSIEWYFRKKMGLL